MKHAFLPPGLLLALFLMGSPALAHAHLQKSVPATAAKVKSPKHVVLTFSEALEPAFSGALLMDDDGRNLTGGQVVVNGPVMRFSPGHLAPGKYKVVWHVVGHDTHRMDGEFSFTVKP